MQSDHPHGLASPRTDRAGAGVSPSRSSHPRARRLLALLALALWGAAALATSAHATNVRPNGEVKATCTSITYRFFGFPNANNNTVTEKVFVHEQLVDEQQFSFNGTSGENTIPITVPPGPGKVDGYAVWNTNGFKGSYDVNAQLNCSFPNFTIEKLQEIEGSGAGFTREPLIAPPGKTVDYEIKITNTGNTVLTFSQFTETRCGNLTGGPTGPLSPGESATYLCRHTLTLADKEKDSEGYENTATITGTPPKGQGTAKRKPSNTVVVRFPAPNERPNGEVKASCNSITFVYKGFPNANNNTVTERVYVKTELILTKTFVFNGPEGSDTIKITVPPGASSVDGFAVWNTNGFKGSYDVTQTVKCNATPAFTIEKTQKIEGGAEPFTSGSITGAVGQTIDYRITVANTGNTSLTFSNFIDANCTGVAGGPSGAMPYETAATYTCHHTITLADGGTEYENTATVTATPPSGQGSAITQSSNTVLTSVPVKPEPSFTLDKAQTVAGSGKAPTALPIEVERGQTISYVIEVTNTGNTSVTFSGFSDPECDEGTLTGGPTGALEPGGSTSYNCEHLVTRADEIVGKVTNAATVTGTPPPVDGEAKTQESNSVEASVAFTPEAAFSAEKRQRDSQASAFTADPIVIPGNALIEYEIVVDNTGNQALSLAVYDPGCEALSGGPGEGEQLAPGQSTTYTCSLSVTAGEPGHHYTNTATVTGTPPAPLSPVQHESNTVSAEVEQPH